MKCSAFEKWLLLEQTGELSARQQVRLQAHVGDCARCRAYQVDLGRLTGFARPAAPAGPAPAVMARIRVAAQQRTIRPARALDYGQRWILAWAAILLVVLGLGFASLLGRSLRTSQLAHRTARLVETSALLTLVMPQDEPTEASAGAEAESADDLRVLARQLLQLEGMADEAADQDLNPTAEPSPTTLREHSSPEGPPSECA